MRCPDCNKFVSFDTDVEPDVSLDVADDGGVSGSCRIVNACADCGTGSGRLPRVEVVRGDFNMGAFEPCRVVTASTDHSV